MPSSSSVVGSGVGSVVGVARKAQSTLKLEHGTELSSPTTPPPSFIPSAMVRAASGKSMVVNVPSLYRNPCVM